MRPATTSESLDFLLTAKDVAELLCISVRDVWRKASAGKIPKPVHVSKKATRWKGSAIQAYLDSLQPAES